jgi:hypothetical protein
LTGPTNTDVFTGGLETEVKLFVTATLLDLFSIDAWLLAVAANALCLLSIYSLNYLTVLGGGAGATWETSVFPSGFISLVVEWATLIGFFC